MSLSILAINKDIDGFLREQTVWRKRGIDTIRVDTMQEAINKLTNKQFLFVAISADTVTYMPLLKIMSDIATAYIFIFDSNFTYEKQNEAFDNGAAWYTQFHDDPEENVKSALSFLNSIKARRKTPEKTPRTFARCNLTILADYNKAFCNDVEVVFTPKEYGILHYLLNNPNNTLTFDKISHKVWGGEAVSNNAIWQVIIRLRRKLEDAGFNGGDIINFRGVGYRFVTQLDK